MIRTFMREQESVVERPGIDLNGCWIDLLQPNIAELQQATEALGFALPSPNDTALLSPNDRFYEEDGRIVLTVTAISRDSEEYPKVADITLICTDEVLVTIRHVDPLPFKNFTRHLQEHPELCGDGRAQLLNLMSAFINRLSEYVQVNGASLYDGSKLVFTDRANKPLTTGEFQGLVSRIGQNSDVNAKARECLLSFGLATEFLINSFQVETVHGQHARQLERDIAAITNYADFVANQRAFLLESVLGLLTLEQSRVSKILSVFATIFLPPTLIASIYGMNFQFMPELSSPWGYPVALLVMLASAIVPYSFCRYKGWL